MPDDSGTEKPANPVADEQLMLAFCRGSKEAFTELFSRYKQPLFGFFCRRIANAREAEELTQETFLAVLRGSSRYEPSALFRTYLYAIALKSCELIVARLLFGPHSSERSANIANLPLRAQLMRRYC